jgi:hypothetical protein
VISHVKVELKTNVLDTCSVSEKLGFSSTLIKLTTQENFNAFICHESFKSYFIT